MSGRDEAFQITRVLAYQSNTCVCCGVKYYPPMSQECYDTRIYCSAVCSAAKKTGLSLPLTVEAIRQAKEELRKNEERPYFRQQEVQDIVSPEAEFIVRDPHRGESIQDYLRVHHAELGPLKPYAYQAEAIEALFPPVSFEPGAINQLCPNPSAHRSDEGVNVVGVLKRWIGKLREFLGC